MVFEDDDIQTITSMRVNNHSARDYSISVVFQNNQILAPVFRKLVVDYFPNENIVDEISLETFFVNNKSYLEQKNLEALVDSLNRVIKPRYIEMVGTLLDTNELIVVQRWLPLTQYEEIAKVRLNNQHRLWQGRFEKI